ncbi:hypothetical protein O0I10_005600 [Lichtheimia ornata]|uniref:BRCT domain-containing protein n=1 Tax=Lichtheimia ornata TaxID=688661 RepID=A0AAD7V5C6_9FUNG|nr:uncharacterized protein O0I10_005600 [Lichtheimia ornata]KAJ8658560.1 hypothetical protein O0I10_005600 [Lichtheimia ornata]
MRALGESKSVPLFCNVKYDFHRTLTNSKRNQLEKILNSHGAERCYHEEGGLSSQEATETTHIISTRKVDEQDVQKDIFVVTPAWVEAAEKNGFVHDPKYYKPDPQLFFSGMVVATANLSTHDNSAIKGAVERYGGQYAKELLHDVTHVIANSDHGDRYKKATKLANVQILHPQFIHDCVKNERLVLPDRYLMPDPVCLRQDDKETKSKASGADGDADALFPLHNAVFQYPGFNYKDNKNFWPRDLEVSQPYLKGHCFYFVHDYDYLALRTFDWEGRLKKAGAEIASSYNDKVTIVVVKYRDSPEYIQACRDGKMVASMWWVSNTLMRQRVEPPTRRLLDYPMPRGAIPGMENMAIVISGYRGVARNFLRHLVHRCGCKFQAVIDSSVTHLIASSHTSKYREAREANIPIVNHLWLEDCYQRWEKLPLSDERYTHFVDGRIVNKFVGDTKLIPKDLECWWKEGLSKPAEVMKTREKVPSSSKEQQPSKTATPSPPPPSTTTITQPRQAARKAASKLEDVFIPDMNKYQKEVRSGYSMVGEEMPDEPSKGKDVKREDDTMMDIDDNKATGSKRTLEHESPEPRSNESMPSSKTIKIVTSSINLDRREKNGILDLGGQMVENVTQATHLLVEKALRTPKFLCAVNLGLKIVHHKWLRQSIEEQKWLDASDFAVQDKAMEKKYDFNLEESLSIAQERVVPGKHPHGTWLSTFEVYVLQSNKAEALKGVIETAGGKLITKLPARRLKELLQPDSENQLLVVSDPEDKSKWGDYTKQSIPIYSVELIIVGALRQKLDVDEFRLE